MRPVLLVEWQRVPREAAVGIRVLLRQRRAEASDFVAGLRRGDRPRAVDHFQESQAADGTGERIIRQRKQASICDAVPAMGSPTYRNAAGSTPITV